MALSPRLDLKQSQQLVMTPQLQQAIKLLQLSNLELVDYITQEVERNPILEIGEGDNKPTAEEHSGEGGGTAQEEGLRDASDTWSESESGSNDTGLISADQSMNSAVDTGAIADSALDTNYDQNVFQHDSGSDIAAQGLSLSQGSSTSSGPRYGDDDRSLEQTLEEDIDLHSHLVAQIPLIAQNPVEQMVAHHIVDLVDEAGYIQTDALEELRERLGLESDALEECVKRLQSMEPTGVFARSLQECLALQLAEKDRLDPAMSLFLDNLDLLAKRELPSLKRICDVDDEDLTDMIAEIRALNPKPGLAFGGINVTPAVPDVFIRKSRAGTWVVELNTETLPKVLVNNQYLVELSTVSGGEETKAFISECQSNANWLMKALDQRARTILKVATALIKSQEQFFEYGVRFLKPMTLKDIADEIEMHESTVSRVTSNKFLSCPRGLFELKYFFTSAIGSSHGGDALSAEAVKFRIKELIDAESPKKILSDDKLVQILKAEGMDIARRTVAKYREALRIPSSVQRRRLKNIG